MGGAGKKEMREPVRVQMLGEFAVASSESAVHLPPARQTQRLLAALLMAQGRPVAKVDLIDMLWPRARPSNPIGTIEVYVSAIRKALGDRGQDHDPLLTTRDGAYRLAGERLIVDLHDFDDSLRAAFAHVRPSERVDALSRTIELYRGDLLDTFDETWLDEPRQFYRDKLTQALLLSSRDALLLNEPVRCIRHAQEVLRVVPASEEAFQILMLANHALGFSEQARRAFEQCRDAVSDHLGLDLRTSTEELHSAIDAGEPPWSLIAEYAQSGAEPSPLRRDRRATIPRLFVGRAKEREVVFRHIAEMVKGPPRLITVEGRAGLGRTALLSQISIHSAYPCGSVEYRPTDLDAPLAPLASAIRTLAAGTLWESAAHDYADGNLLDPFANQRVLVDLLRCLGPSVVLLDDTHWADAASIEAIRSLVTVDSGLALTVVATARARQIPHGLRDISVDHLSLDPVDIGDADDAEMAAAIEYSGGDPTLMADVIRWRRSGRHGTSVSLRQIVTRRLRLLDFGVVRLLDAAARLPEPFAADQLFETAAVDRFESCDDVIGLYESGYLTATSVGFRFASPAVREVLRALSHPTASIA